LRHYILQQGGFVVVGTDLTEKVRRLLKSDPKLINFKDKDGSTPLLWALWQNVDGSHVPLITWLIKNGADVNATDEKALHH